MPPALRIKNLIKTYAGGVTALVGVDLEVAHGDFFSLLGPNGAGKTTLISIVSGLVVKSSGYVEIFGVNIDEDHDKAKSFIGVVPQEFNFHIFEKVIDIIVNQAGYYGIARRQSQKDAEVILKDLGLWEKRNVQAKELSGGMKRRLMIARALIHHPQFLILDEPTAGVDVELRREMWEYLVKLNKSGVTIVLTTHYLEEAEQLCRNVAIIDAGMIIKSGSMKSLVTKLNSVTLLFDTSHTISEEKKEEIKKLGFMVVDENTFEITLTSGQSVNEVVEKLSHAGVVVVNIRSKSSRLEEAFINLTTK